VVDDANKASHSAAAPSEWSVGNGVRRTQHADQLSDHSFRLALDGQHGHRKLVAAEACRRHRRRKRGIDASPDVDQQLVAGAHAEQLIDRRQPFDVGHDQHDLRILQRGAVGKLAQFAEETDAVEQTGQRVTFGQERSELGGEFTVVVLGLHGTDHRTVQHIVQQQQHRRIQQDQDDERRTNAFGDGDGDQQRHHQTSERRGEQYSERG
jgi:hypothetical protein